MNNFCGSSELGVTSKCSSALDGGMTVPVSMGLKRASVLCFARLAHSPAKTYLQDGQKYHQRNSKSRTIGLIALRLIVIQVALHAFRCNRCEFPTEAQERVE